MIPILAQPEPADFNTKVRRRGLAFLRNNPKTKNWDPGDYWRDVLMDLHDAYHGICAYCCHWIPRDEGAATVDHFVPKSIKRKLAYEWSNYRLASLTMNGRKSDYTDVLDPFTLKPNWFILEFPSLLIKPSSSLTQLQKSAVWATINRLKLNKDDRCVKGRQNWLMPFCRGDCNFAFLMQHAPFIAYELQRQGLISTIASIMTA